LPTIPNPRAWADHHPHSALVAEGGPNVGASDPGAAWGVSPFVGSWLRGGYVVGAEAVVSQTDIAGRVVHSAGEVLELRAGWRSASRTAVTSTQIEDSTRNTRWAMPTPPTVLLTNTATMATASNTAITIDTAPRA
jgi:hypothetical protein